MRQMIDARGLACPLPVVKANQVLSGMQDGLLEVHVDNNVAVENLRRMAQQRGLETTVCENDAQHFVVCITVNAAAHPTQGESAACSPCGGDYIVAVDSNCMGRGSEELGKTLMKGFLFALSQSVVLPKAILFYNSGAYLTTEGNDSLEDLHKMAAQGVEIFTCGTCLNYYGLTEKLAVGSVTNMYAIVEAMHSAGKVIKP